MSGVFGIVDFAALRVEPGAFRQLAESAAYRAPAGIGYRFLGEAGLAYLALHPEEGGLEQPLLDHRRRVCVLFDGRLDNRLDLIARLDPLGGSAASDARLLLAAYLEWGVECTDHLLGDFAFSVWDADRHSLLCAVDPLGLKPLHYARMGSLVCFASDAVQVLAHPAVPDGYNESEIAAYLANQCEDPERSFFASVHKLAPGQRLIAAPEGMRVERYWSPSPGEIRYSRDEDYAAHFLEILQRSVTDRLRNAGSFVGIAMSGGLDSTSVAALAQRSPGAKARAYTFSFNRLAGCDERSYSRAMTEELGLEVECLDTERLWALESQGTLPVSSDTPFIGWRSCYEEIYRRMASRGCRVLLTGHGGDDLLRGSALTYAERLGRGDLSAVSEVVRYARKQNAPLLPVLYRYFGRPHLPAKADSLLRAVSGRRKEPLLPALVHSDFARRVDLAGRAEMLRPPHRFASPARQDLYANLVGSPWYWRFANWHERSSTLNGVEVRHPFLDQRLFEYVLAIPGERLFRLDTCKPLLRRALAGILPDRVRSRESKTKFVDFLDFGLKVKARDEVQELLREPRSADLGILDGDVLRTAWAGFLDGGSHDLRRALWYAITLEIWLRRGETIKGRRPGAFLKGAAA
jgi:asparagine synthase (glutamine-hydrolysing)